MGNCIDLANGDTIGTLHRLELRGGILVGRRFAEKEIVMSMPEAKFPIGRVVRHRVFPFRGVIFDVDPVFNNTEEWYQAIPEDVRPRKDQPFYHLFAENDQVCYVAYVSEQNLLVDDSGEPIRHPDVGTMFDGIEDGCYTIHSHRAN